ncbi:hypothetical protein ACSBR1_015333 [Camellia fascicularis]
MDWLLKYHATIDCVTKQVVFRPPNLPEFTLSGVGVSSPYLISSMTIGKLLRKGYCGYLCCILHVPTVEETNADNIPIVKEFPNVFSDDLPGKLIDRETEFTIEVIPGTQSISKTPYRMSTTELKELKIQPLTLYNFLYKCEYLYSFNTSLIYARTC